ncbi:MAG TPA: FAD-dependent monooxygenase [Steroidobacteraceae bacterium]|nr:FAD-dependent monooxygenase [Steroidobacteraceae bacterium]
MRHDFDVVVVGGGLAGACAAALLARHAGLAAERVGLLSEESPVARVAGDPAELRVVAISRASERVLRAAGAWSRLDPERLCAYERVRVWHETSSATGPSALRFDAADIAEPNLGFIAENSALVRACLDSFTAAGGSRIDSMLERASFDAAPVILQAAGGRELSARLVVGADGSQSVVRASAGLSARTLDYRQLAIVATVRTSQSHENTAWQRFLRTGPLALLPLFDGHSSIVWSVDQGPARELLDLSEQAFNERLTAASDEVLGSARVVSQRISFPLRSLAARSYVAPRCALVGDAAHVVHPLAGQGANLGLLDAAALCEVIADAIAEREDPGALRALRRYEQQRRTHNLMMDSAMSAFRAGFAASVGPAALLVNTALGAVNRSGALKRLFARQALGTAGALPKYARNR